MANDDFYEFIKKAVGGEAPVYKDQEAHYKFDPYDVNNDVNRSWRGSFDVNRIFIKGECVNCKHYVCPKEDKVEDSQDDVVIYQCVLCPGCLKGHSVLSKDKTRPCIDFERFPI